MFKRLIFAVFVMGLVLTFCGTAISDIVNKKEGLNPVPTVNPNAYLYGVALEDARPVQSDHRITHDPVAFETGDGSLTPPSGYACDIMSDWCDTTYYSYIWDVTADFDVFAHRFTVEGLDICTVMAANFRMLTLSGYMTGTPGMRVYLYADDGFGLPGAKLDSVDIPHNPAWYSSTWSWFSADFVNDGNNNGGNFWVFGNGDEFHVGATLIGTPGVDGLVCATDQAQPWPPHSGQERSTISGDGGASWVTMLTAAGADFQFRMNVEYCGFETPFTDCYDQMYADNGWYIWKTPHPDYSFPEWAQRFTTNGPETLQYAEVGVLEWWETGDPVGQGDGSNDLIVTLYDDAGGLPGTALASVTIPGGSYPFYPTWVMADFTTAPGWPFVFDGDFHIGFATSGTFTGDPATATWEVLYGDDGNNPQNRGSLIDSPGWEVPAGDWCSMVQMYGLDENFKISAHLCIDPYNDCKTMIYNTDLSYFWYLPDVYGTTAQAQRIKARGEECRIGEVAFSLYDNGDLGAYATDSKISVYSDGLGMPQIELGSIDVGPSTSIPYVFSPAKLTVDFDPLEIYVTEGWFWVAIESYGTDETDGIRTLSDFGGGVLDYGAAENWGGSWGLLTNNWIGVPSDIALAAQASFCCIPLPVWDCEIPDHDWNTSQFDAARTGHSQVEVGAPAEDLNYNWDYTHPTQGNTFGVPTVYDGKVICPFTDQLQVFDLNDGTLLYTIDVGAGLFGPGTIRNAPLATNLNGTDVVFVTSGTGQGIYCFNFDTGALIWAYDLSTGGVLLGNMRYCSFQLMNVFGDDVLFVGTDNGNVAALDAITGSLWLGWGVNPINLTFGVNRSGATDGMNLFYATEAGGFDCDVFSVQATSGGINWQLSATSGLQADNVYPTEAVAGEVFRSAVAFYDGQLYANSYVSQGDHPADGVFYSIKAGDGSVKYAVPSARSMYSTPVLDQEQVYVGFYSRWVNPPVGGNLAAFNRRNGNVNWVFTTANDDGYYGELAISCEGDDPDITPDVLFAAGHSGFFSCIETVDGTELFRRQTNYGTAGAFDRLGNGIALTPGDGVDFDYHLVYSNLWGGLICLSKDMTRTVRPRLEIQSYNPKVPVEFGVATSWPTTLPALLTNTGGAPLTINDITTDDACFDYHPQFSSVRPGVAETAMKIADHLTGDVIVKAPQINDAFDELTSVRGRTELMKNAGAMARPAFIQTATDGDGILFPTDGTVLAVGDTVDVIIDINQSLVLRGPQFFSMHVNSNDPDFYLNSEWAGTDPCIWVTVVGGCLIDTTALTFGMGCGNTQSVYNTGRIATGDDWATPWGFDIDGDDASMFQGAYLYAVSTYEVALNTQAWHGGGEEESYISMQPDPNWYDGECKSPLVDPYDASCFGGYTEDGITYTPITGKMVAKSYIDSVQNFDDGGGWDWTWYEAPFDNALTMGLYVNTRTIGVCDFEPLKDVTVEIMEFTERNGNAITDWKFGSTFDYDIGGDLATMDASISAGWAYAGGGGDVAWGQIKLPYGCCNMLAASAPYTTTFAPFKNSRSLHGNGAWWADIYLDSAYAFMSMPPGATSQTLSSDEECHFTLAEHDFAGNETFTIAVANFGLHGMTDPTDPAEIAPLSTLVNKWVGFGRGDVNNDGELDIRDLVHLKNYVYGFGPGPIPFMHLGDVNVDGAVDGGDISYLFAWYFMGGPVPQGDWCF
ncbi:MAG: PQQ-binding-like beta-propeller repeat protein [bacterium]